MHPSCSKDDGTSGGMSALSAGVISDLWRETSVLGHAGNSRTHNQKALETERDQE